MYQILRKLMEEKQLVEIYSDPDDTDIFYLGYIIACDDNFNVMSLVTRFGAFDGYRLEENAHILNIQTDTMYMKRIQHQMDYYETQVPELVLKSQDIVSELLDYARQLNHIVCITIINSTYTDAQGYIESIQDGICSVKQVDDNGFKNGMGYLKVADITKFAFLGEDEVRLDVLYKANNSD